MLAPASVAASTRRPLAPLALALLRIGIGWHVAYEGLAKLLDANWTAAGYLQSADGPAAVFFHWLARDPQLLAWVDPLNAWGLLLIGAALMLGCCTRAAAILGALLLGLYYLAHPPLFGPSPAGAEGSYLIVNKNLVELVGLLVVAVLPAGSLGLDRLFAAAAAALRRRGPSMDSVADAAADGVPALAERPAGSRRQLLAGLLGLPFVGGFVMAVLKKHGYRSEEEGQLAARVDGASGASMKFDWQSLDQLKGKVPTARIGQVELSRVMMGGNLMNGFAHARDLIYVSHLIKAYHHREKIFETLRLGEACGINTIITNPILAPMIVDYWEHGGGKIQFLAQCKGKNEAEFLDNIAYALDHGAVGAYVQGEAADRYVQDGNFAWIARGLERIRAAGKPAGIGGHSIDTIKGCVAEGLAPDFWMKTLHHTRYWSARVEQQHDNIWCEDPDETIRFIRDLPQPWIAFKVLAAGAITPQVGFKYAFENGADFVCVGMYDFQVVEDANIAFAMLNDQIVRQRPWCA